MTHREIGEYVQAQNDRQEEDFKKQAILLDGLYRQWISTQQKKPRVLNLKELYPSLFGKKSPRHMTPEERRHVPGLQPKRSDIIVAGLLIAKSFLQRYHIPAITVSERDLMEGVFFRHSFHDAAWNSRDRQS